MTPKQQRFVDEYLIDCNATQAYIRAGYIARTDDVAKANGSRLLANDNVSRAIAEAQQERSARVQVSQDWVLSNLVELSQRCMQKVPVMTFDKEDRSYRQEEDIHGQGVWEFDSTGANRSLELLGKHLGLFNDKTDHSGAITIKVVREEIA